MVSDTATDLPLPERINHTLRASCDALATSSFERARQHQARNNNTSAKKVHVTRSLATLALSCALGFGTLGYQITVLNAPGAIVQAWINTSYTRRRAASAQEDRVSSSTIQFIYALATGALAGGAIIGGLAAGPVAERLGRRTCQLFIAITALVTNGLMGLSGYVYSPELLIVGRAIIGISIGAATVVSPMYITEASPREIRGSIGVINHFGTVICLMFAQILGLPLILGTAKLWPSLFFVAAVLPAAQVVLTLMCPESPRYLYISRGKQAEAVQALRRLRAPSINSSISEEICEYEQESQAHEGENTIQKVTVWQLFQHKKYFRPLSVVIILQLSMMWSGINGIIGYSMSLFRQAGLPPYQATFANLAVGVVLIGMTCVTIVLVDRIGRRILHLTGVAGMIILGIVITVLSLTSHINNASSTSPVFSIIIILCILLYLSFFAVGPTSLPWIVTSELFSQEARGPASSIGSLVNWICQLVTFVGFPWLQGVLGDWVFLPFAISLSIFFVFLYRFMPETKGKTFEQISEFFVDNKRTISRPVNVQIK